MMRDPVWLTMSFCLGDWGDYSALCKRVVVFGVGGMREDAVENW